MRLNQYIAHHTSYSRREADVLIREGKVHVNRVKVSQLATKISETDRVSLNGKVLKAKGVLTVIVYHKPKGELVSKRDDRQRRVIYDTLPRAFCHFLPVGRLDYASEGLLLLTDSVPVASALMDSDLERMYYVKVHGQVKEELIVAMREGLFLADASLGAHPRSAPRSMQFRPFLAYKLLHQGKQYAKLKVVIAQGQNRELRRFFAHFGTEVVGLKRVSYGRVHLGMLKPRQHRYLSASEYADLRDYLGTLSVRY